MAELQFMTRLGVPFSLIIISQITFDCVGVILTALRALLVKLLTCREFKLSSRLLFFFSSSIYRCDEGRVGIDKLNGRFEALVEITRARQRGFRRGQHGWMLACGLLLTIVHFRLALLMKIRSL